jgi:hypothetical protein
MCSQEEDRSHSILANRRDLATAAALFLGLVLWHLPALTLSPAVNHDEVMLNAAARNWTAHGVPALSPLAEKGGTYGQAYYWHPPGFLLLMAAAYKVFGFSIEVTRGVSLVAGASAVALLFQILRVLGVDRRYAVLGAFLLAAHPLFWWLCRSGRMDLIALDLGFLAILLAAGNRDSPTIDAAATGLLVGVGGLFHVMVLSWAPAIAMANASRERRIDPARTALTIGGAIFPVAIWAGLAFGFGDGPAFQEQFVGYQLGQRSGTGAIWQRPMAELWLFISQMRFQPTLLLMAAVGVWLGCRNRTPTGRWVLAGWITAILLIAFGTSKGTGAYPLYWYVWVLMVTMVAIHGIEGKWRLAVISLALLNAAFVQAGTAAIGLYQKAARDPSRADRFFAQHIRRGSVVVGSEDIWYSLEHAGAQLRIWVEPDARRHDYVVTYANVPAVKPEGFDLLAEQPDLMPKVGGRYFSHTPCSYRIWIARPAVSHPEQPDRIRK